MMLLLNKTESLINAIISKIDGIHQLKKNYPTYSDLYMGLCGKYNFINMARYGSFNGKPYRNYMEKLFDCDGFNAELICSHCSNKLILAYDSSYLPQKWQENP